MILYAATSNANKLAEFSTAAAHSGSVINPIEVYALPGLTSMPEPVEDAATFMGNAEKKAIAYSLLASCLLVFADDSGLEVDSLGGEPGVRSARFADDANFEPHSSAGKDTRNNLLVLDRLANLPPYSSRSARFVCALAVARDGEVLLRSEGNVDGELLHAPRGTDGFGYDPLFLIPSLGHTLAELSRPEKWKISHRGNAFRNLLTQLRSNNLT
jgi:XTP/dITP diphosphohydrolase